MTMFTARQSTVSGFAVCPRRTYYDITREGDWTVGYSEATADLGSVVHAAAAEIMRTLREQGEQWMPTEEALVIAWEVYNGMDVVLPPDECDALRICILALVERPWRAHAALVEGTDLEEDPDARLRTDVLCPDGVTREFTGRPDLIVADPPETVIVVDLKSGRGKPKEPRQKPAEGEVVQGTQYLSARGHAQLDGYGLLVMRRYPSVMRVILREFHLRSGAVREATLERHELEHVEREIADLLMKLDRGLSEGEGSKLWKPRPGAHCRKQCPVARSCPVPQEQRGLGAVSTLEDALREGERYQVVDGLRGQLRDALAGWHDDTGQPIPVGHGMELRRATPDEHKSRTFGLWPVLPPQEEVDLVALLEESIKQVKGRRHA